MPWHHMGLDGDKLQLNHIRYLLPGRTLHSGSSLCKYRNEGLRNLTLSRRKGVGWGSQEGGKASHHCIIDLITSLEECWSVFQDCSSQGQEAPGQGHPLGFPITDSLAPLHVISNTESYAQVAIPWPGMTPKGHSSLWISASLIPHHILSAGMW